MFMRRLVYAGLTIAAVGFSDSAVAQDHVVVQLVERIPLLDFIPPCELTFSAQNLGSQSIDSIKVGISIKDSRGNTIKSQNINFRYIDPGKSSQPRTIKAPASCGGIVVRLHNLEECVIMRKKRKTCVLSAASRVSGIRFDL